MDATAEQNELERNRRRRVTVKNAARSFTPIADRYPPILSLEQAAEIALLKPSTLKRLISEGEFKYCVSRGKPLRFFRDKFVVELMR